MQEAFLFLETDFGFWLNNCEQQYYGSILEYTKGELRVHLFYDFKDNFFYFSFVRGLKTKTPNDHDFENVKTFIELFKKYEPGFDPESIQPNNEGYDAALLQNAELLKKHCLSILEQFSVAQ